MSHIVNYYKSSKTPIARLWRKAGAGDIIREKWRMVDALCRDAKFCVSIPLFPVNNRETRGEVFV